MTEGLACGDDGGGGIRGMTIFIPVIPASKIQSSRPSSRDLPNSLAPLKWPFKEIPAQEHAGMTRGLACGDDEGLWHPWDDYFHSCHPGEYAVFIRNLPNSLASLK